MLRKQEDLVGPVRRAAVASTSWGLLTALLTALLPRSLAVDPAHDRSVELVVQACYEAADLVGAPAVSAAWDRPSALEGMTVGALAAHLVRGCGGDDRLPRPPRR